MARLPYLSPEDLAETEGQPNTLEPLAKLVLQGAREIYADGMSAATVAKLQGHMTNEQMMDLAITAAF